MRTLKVLSLVLALVLCFGLVGTAFAANTDKFEDADKIGDVYNEAVEVLIGAGIVDGKTETTVDPTGNYTREAAAKIIAYMLLGKNLADSLPKDVTPFDDVAAGRWSAGYIAYCANEGIISGVAAGKFNPQGTLSGYAFAKMLLVALGYKGEYEGASWSINVAKDAIKAGIFAGDLAAATNQPIQRQQAMLMAFNGLFKGEPVSVTSTKYITDGSVTGTTLYNDWATAQAAVAAGDKLTGSVTVTETQMKGSLADDVYGLTKAVSTDAYNRPTTAYTINNKRVATIEAGTTKVYYGPVTEAQVYKDLGLTAAVAGATISVDGAAAAAATLAANGGVIAASGNGTELDVYYNAAANTVAMYAINTYFGTVGAVTPATATAKEKVTVAAGTAPVNGMQYEIAGLKAGDPVIMTYSAKGTPAIVTLAKATPVTLKPTQFVTTAGRESLTADKVYSYGKNFVACGGAFYANAAFPDQNVVLDGNGFIIGFTAAAGPAAAPDKYAILLNQAATDNWPAPAGLKAQVLNADGSIEILPTVVLAGGAAINDVVTVAPGVGAATGKTVLTKVATPAATSIAITKNTVAITGGKANDKTIFLVKTAGATPGTFNYNQYVGIGNVPTITGSAASAVYDKNADGFAEFVWVDTATLFTPPTTVTAVSFVTATGTKSYTDKDKGAVTVYNAVKDGAIGTVDANVAIATGLYSAFTTDANGIATAATALTASGAIGNIQNGVTGITKPANGVVAIGGNEFVYNENTTVYKVNKTTGVISASSIAATAADAAATVYSYTNSGILAAIYIVA